MARINTPADISAAPEAAQAHLQAVEGMLGSVPNLFRIVSNSPASLDGYLSLNGALGNGALSASTRERLALAVAEVNGCDYCLAAHTQIAASAAGLSGEEIMANRRGTSTDVKADAAVKFAVEIVKARGKVDAASVEAVRAAGYTEAEIVEIIAHVALNTLTNYMNNVLDTDVDFPKADALAG